MCFEHSNEVVQNTDKSKSSGSSDDFTNPTTFLGIDFVWGLHYLVLKNGMIDTVFSYSIHGL